MASKVWTKAHAARRFLSDVASSTTCSTREGWIFVDSVFPIRLGSWDLRYYLGRFGQERRLNAVRTRLQFLDLPSFRVLSLEPYSKDGGVFVKFQHDPSILSPETIEAKLQEHADAQRRTWSPSCVTGSGFWVVKGNPWREDLRRFASPLVRISFEGPDVNEETLYNLLRPYGPIEDIEAPRPGTPGTPRYSLVEFYRARSATIARHTLHNLEVQGPGGSTRVRLSFQPRLQEHVIHDWLSSHPRIVIPVLVLLLGTLTYVVFDPLRGLMVRGKLLSWFDVSQSSVFLWVRRHTVDRFSLLDRFSQSFFGENSSNAGEPDLWEDRKEARSDLATYLADPPTTVAFVHGPQGSGKSRIVARAVNEAERPALLIDCAVLLNGSASDSQVLKALARQTGYWPIFPFLSSVSQILDMASVGLMGQKAGLSSSLSDQVRQMLTIVASALVGVGPTYQKQVLHKPERAPALEPPPHQPIEKPNTLGLTNWVEPENDGFAFEKSPLIVGKDGEQPAREETVVVSALPVIVIRNFPPRGRIPAAREELLDVIARWAASLSENRVAHVVVLSDNRENAKPFAKALPTKPLHTIALYDADSATALAFVRDKLRRGNLTPRQVQCVERLGGRASDLESMIHKVRSGQSIEEAVEDLISGAIGELCKNAFGDDPEDAKDLLWSRSQAWMVLKSLTARPELLYYDLLVKFPFKGDETALKGMEHAGIVSITWLDGRPSTIRPGKPIFKYVFERLTNDPVFRATQDMSFNKQLIGITETTVKDCEDELLRLKQIGTESSWFGLSSSATRDRARDLFRKLHAAQRKIVALERKNDELAGVLAKGDS
ncbi:hypothetical protein FISHEDRAFT_52862 [Fistulina hepatica ATCC 64428]|nr:hypothetical protein FISHEDRAFT_52862 [Fistulina hepatica ATCC 64428]